jgi:transcriptional regulator with XRE-family HTH domain
MTRLKECRENAHLSQKYVAITLGISSPSVANWERGKTNPTQENIVKLADLYGVSVDYLLGRTDDVNGAADDESPFPQLSKDEIVLLERYRALSDEDKELLRSDALRMKREAERGTGYAVKQTAG